MAVQDPFAVAHERVLERDVAEVAAELQEQLGQKLVAFALGDRHPKTVGRYARGERTPDDATHRGLVDLLVVVEILKTGMRAEAVKSWMLGANPRLRGKAPIEMVHEGHGAAVLDAARAFVSRR